MSHSIKVNIQEAAETCLTAQLREKWLNAIYKFYPYLSFFRVLPRGCDGNLKPLKWDNPFKTLIRHQ